MLQRLANGPMALFSLSHQKLIRQSNVLYKEDIYNIYILNQNEIILHQNKHVKEWYKEDTNDWIYCPVVNVG